MFFYLWRSVGRRFLTLGGLGGETSGATSVLRTVIFELGTASTTIFELGTASDGVTATFELRDVIFFRINVFCSTSCAYFSFAGPGSFTQVAHLAHLLLQEVHLLLVQDVAHLAHLQLVQEVAHLALLQGA